MKLVMNKKEFSALIKEEVKRALREAVSPTEDQLYNSLKTSRTPMFLVPEMEKVLATGQLPPDRAAALQAIIAASKGPPGTNAQPLVDKYLQLFGNEGVTVPGV